MFAQTCLSETLGTLWFGAMNLTSKADARVDDDVYELQTDRQFDSIYRPMTKMTFITKLKKALLTAKSCLSHFMPARGKHSLISEESVYQI